MSKGFKRGIVGGLALAFATHIVSTVEDFKSMTPNEIADRGAVAWLRQESVDIKRAATQNSGPVFDKVMQDCREDEKDLHASKKFMPLVTAILEAAEGKSIAFNMEACVKQGISSREAIFAGAVPEKGKATEEYKNHMISTSTNGAYVVGALGGILALSGVAAFVRSNRKQPSPT